MNLGLQDAFSRPPLKRAEQQLSPGVSVTYPSPGIAMIEFAALLPMTGASTLRTHPYPDSS